MTDLLTGELEELPPGDARVRACLLLPGGAVRSNDEIRAFLERALVESEGLPEARAAVLANMSTNEAVIRVERIADAEAWAEEALATVRRLGPEMERWALYTLAWGRSLRGRSIQDLRSRFAAVSDDASYILGSPERVAAQQLVWRGSLDEARVVLSSLLSLADDRGEPVSYALARLHLCELELRVGAWEEAARLLDEWAEPSERDVLAWPMYERCRALLAAGRGLVDEAYRWAAESISRADEAGVGWDRLEALRALGTAALLGHDPRRAAESLGGVWAHTERVGVEEPGVFPVAPELVEALVEVGELEKARAVTARLRELAERQAHPWGLDGGEAVRWHDRARGRAPSQAAAAAGAGGGRLRRAGAALRPGADAARARRAQRRARSGARRALRSSRRARPSTRSARPAGPRRRAPSSPGSGAPGRPAGALTPAETRVAALAREGLVEQGDRRGPSSSPSRPSRHTSRTSTRSSACTPGRSSPGALALRRSRRKRFRGFRSFRAGRAGVASAHGRIPGRALLTRRPAPPSKRRGAGASRGGRADRAKARPSAMSARSSSPRTRPASSSTRPRRPTPSARPRSRAALPFERVTEALGALDRAGATRGRGARTDDEEEEP